jgi:hypothetical protein
VRMAQQELQELEFPLGECYLAAFVTNHAVGRVEPKALELPACGPCAPRHCRASPGGPAGSSYGPDDHRKSRIPRLNSRRSARILIQCRASSQCVVLRFSPSSGRDVRTFGGTAKSRILDTAYYVCNPTPEQKLPIKLLIFLCPPP